MKKISRLGVGLLGLALLASACGGDDSDSSSTSTTAASGAAASGNVKCSGVKLAYLGALSGENGALGQNMVDGATIALDEWNATNKDCKIDLEKFDSQGDPTQATPLADKIVQDKSVADIARSLKPGGEFRFASDIPDYIEWTLLRVLRSPDFTWTAKQADDWRKPWPGFTRTRYEAKAVREGRTPCYLIFKRR